MIKKISKIKKIKKIKSIIEKIIIKKTKISRVR